MPVPIIFFEFWVLFEQEWERTFFSSEILLVEKSPETRSLSLSLKKEKSKIIQQAKKYVGN